MQAHQSLVDLENSRDDLLFELHRLGHNNTRDRDLLKEYFEAVDVLSVKLEKQLGVILLRAFATVRDIVGFWNISIFKSWPLYIRNYL